MNMLPILVPSNSYTETYFAMGVKLGLLTLREAIRRLRMTENTVLKEIDRPDTKKVK
jgi:hypothetical protein